MRALEKVQMLSSEAVACTFWCTYVASLMFMCQNPGLLGAMHRMSSKALATLCILLGSRAVPFCIAELLTAMRGIQTTKLNNCGSQEGMK